MFTVFSIKSDLLIVTHGFSCSQIYVLLIAQDIEIKCVDGLKKITSNWKKFYEY